MTYYYNRILKGNFEEVIRKVSEGMRNEGFGVFPNIDTQETLKKKSTISFRKYTIIGSCSPPYTDKVLQVEDRIGAMLPCRVIVQELENEMIEVITINPMATMQEVDNAKLSVLTVDISSKLENIINQL